MYIASDEANMFGVKTGMTVCVYISVCDLCRSCVCVCVCAIFLSLFG